MSFEARKRANKIRGLTIAQRSFYKRLSEFHNAKNPHPFPGTKRLAYDHECSRSYARDVLRALVAKKFITVRGRPRPENLFGEGDDDLRAFEIDFNRWFAYSDEDAERLNKRILGVFRRAVPNPQLAQGFLAAWLEPRRSRSKWKHKRIFIVVDSKSHRRFLTTHIPEIRTQLSEELRDAVGENPGIYIIEAFAKPEDPE